MACENEQVEIVRLLIDHGANIDAKTETKSESGYYGQGLCGDRRFTKLTALHVLCGKKPNPMVTRLATQLLDAGANPNSRRTTESVSYENGDSGGRVKWSETCVQAAILSKNLPVIKLLIEKGARVSKGDNQKIDDLVKASGENWDDPRKKMTTGAGLGPGDGYVVLHKNVVYLMVVLIAIALFMLLN